MSPHLIEPALANEEYSIQIDSISRRPLSPVPDTPTFITVSVVDIFGDMVEGTLMYSTDDGESWQPGELRLIHGIPTNGTYKGTVPPLQTNKEVQYRFDFRDDLGYSGNLIDRFSYSKDIRQPEINDPGIRVFSPTAQIKIRYRLLDYGTGITNSTIYYNVQSLEPAGGKVPAYLETGDRWDGYYAAYLPAQTNGTKIHFDIEAFDYAGNSATKNSNFDVTYQTSRLRLSTELISIDSSKLTAILKFTIQGNFQDESFHNIQAGRMEDGLIVNPRTITYDINESSFNNSQNPAYLNFTLAGNPLKFPFDSYEISTVIAVQEKNIAIDSNTFDSNDFMRDNWWINDGETNVSIIGDETHVSREIRIGRNFFQTFGIMAPIVGGFFLLGATTILKGGINVLAAKITIVIGIFALVFSLTPLIEENKPFTYGLYTTADGLVSALLVMTVIYAVFAILSYRYNVRHAEFDIIGFMIGIATIFLAVPFKWAEAMPLIALIILGLGYGLLTRILWKVVKAKIRWFFTEY
jgi:hypothetical protein